jgi:hypothetical protein
MSSEERKEVLSRSVLVLVMERKESNRLFWTDFGVPLRSRIYYTKWGISEADERINHVVFTFWKLPIEASPITRV